MGCEQKLYAIREVSELTSIKPVTLRAWQRRYNIIQPERTAKGHRLYTERHIEQIKTIQGWLAKGVAIGKVKALLENEAEIDNAQLSDNPQLEQVEEMLSALAQLNRNRGESVLAQVCKEYPLAILHQRFIQPVFEAISQVKRSQQALQFGLFYSITMTKLSAILEAENKAAKNGKCLLVSFEPYGSIDLRLWALALSDGGLNVALIEDIDDISALAGHSGLEKYQALALFACQAPSQAQLELVKDLKLRYDDKLLLNPLLDSLSQI